MLLAGAPQSSRVCNARTRAWFRPETRLWGDDSHKVYYGISRYRPVLQAFLPQNSTEFRPRRCVCTAALGGAWGAKACSLARKPSVRELNRQAVVSRLDMRRQPPAQLVVVEIRMQIGQDRPPRLQRRDQLERLVDRQMGRMRPVAQRIDNPDVEVGKHRKAFGRQPDQIAGI